MNNYDLMINETGFLTAAGKQLAEKTFGTGLNTFLTELGSKDLSIQQLRVIKAVVLQAISEKMINGLT